MWQGEGRDLFYDFYCVSSWNSYKREVLRLAQLITSWFSAFPPISSLSFLPLLSSVRSHRLGGAIFSLLE